MPDKPKSSPLKAAMIITPALIPSAVAMALDTRTVDCLRGCPSQFVTAAPFEHADGPHRHFSADPIPRAEMFTTISASSTGGGFS